MLAAMLTSDHSYKSQYVDTCGYAIYFSNNVNLNPKITVWKMNNVHFILNFWAEMKIDLLNVDWALNVKRV